MRHTAAIVIILLFCYSNAWAVQDWDPLSEFEKDIPVPKDARPQTQSDEWSQSKYQWRENKDQYEITVPLRLPEDADPDFVNYKYSDGELKVVAPKKKLKSFF